MRTPHPMSRVDAAHLLGVDPTADPDSVRHAWRMWARVAHPDVGGDPAHFALLDQARQVLLAPLPPPDAEEWHPLPRVPLRDVLRRPDRAFGLLSAVLAAVTAALLPRVFGQTVSEVSMEQLVVLSAPAALLAALTSVWVTRQLLVESADRGHRITMLAACWMPLALLLVLVSTVAGSSMLPVLPVLALPLVAAVAALDPGAGLWRPIGLRGQ